VTELSQRIAALSPAQREMLLRELSQAQAEEGAAPEPGLALPPLVPRPEEHFQPFPLTEVQEVYWAGRSGLFDLGAPGVTVYFEWEIPGAEAQLESLEKALRRLCDQHPVLRLIMLPDGRQQFLPAPLPSLIERDDLRGLPPAQVDTAIAAAQERFRYHEARVGQWPLFGFLAQILDGDLIRLHAWFDAWLIDGMSRDHLMRDLGRFLRDPEARLPPLPFTYRDYAVSQEAVYASEPWRRARDWWLERIPTLPPPPELPLAVRLGPEVRARFVHRVAPLLGARAWARFQEKAARRSLTASPALVAAFVEVIRAWSRQPSFSFSLEGTWYPPLHPRLSEIVGNFNTIYIAVADEPRGSFGERVRRMQSQITELLDHRLFSGFQVLREIRRLRGGGTRSLMPVNFNNLVDQIPAAPAADSPETAAVEELDMGINPPQILIMPSIYRDAAGGLSGKLQAVEEVFPPGMVQDLWAAYTDLLGRLAADDALWESEDLGLAPPAYPELPTPAATVLQETSQAPLPEGEPLEDELGPLAGQILGTGPLSPEDDFFVHGGTSFTAVLLLTRTRERFGNERDLTGFLSAPTPRHLARLVRSGPPARVAVAPAAARKPAPLSSPAATGSPASMKPFFLLWFGQLVSSFGTALGSFSLGVWVFEKSGSTTQFAMIGFVVMTISLVITPIAGVIADRWDRKRLLILADCGAAAMTLLMALALWTDRLEPWHVFFIAPLMAGFGTFQGPALIATVSSIVPRSQLSRANGMSQIASSVTSIIGPLAAGALIGLIGYHGVILVDFSTFLIGVATLALIRIPRARPAGRAEEKRSFRSDLFFGFSYFRTRPGLLRLLGLFAFTNFAIGIVQVLLTPLLLGFGTPLDLGTVNAAGAVGVLLGSVLLSIWGGPRRRVWGIFWFMILQGLILLLGGLQPSLMLITAASFVFMFAVPIVSGCNQAIWQSKVDHGVQGRVMAARAVIAGTAVPAAYLLAGPLADHVFEPLLAPGGALAGSVGRLIGVGEGRGVGLLFMVLGVFIILTICLAFLNPRLRKVESELEDPPA
jgi:DHA3 family macrolide efflux protein-like MFS transporter